MSNEYGQEAPYKEEEQGEEGLLTRHSASTSYMALDVSYALEISLIKGFPIPPPPPPPTYKALLL